MGPKSDSGIGHVDRTVGPHRGAVQELHPTSDGHIGEGGSGALVEGAGKVDVRHPQRIAVNGQPLGCIQGHALLPAFDELEVVGRTVRPEPADVAVVVLGRGSAVDVGHEPDVEIAIVAGRLRALQVGGLPYLAEPGRYFLVHGSRLGQRFIGLGSLGRTGSAIAGAEPQDQGCVGEARCAWSNRDATCSPSPQGKRQV